MHITEDEARTLLQARALRITSARVAVLRALSETLQPLTYTEVLERLGESGWNPATIYRNLIKLRDAGLASVVDRVDGMDRYALAGADEAHCHPHFVCEDCNRVQCLPAELVEPLSMAGPWGPSIRGATVQLRGRCPNCL